MVRIFLAVVGAAYVGLAVWCVAAPRRTSQSVGFELQPGGGQSEYLVVYGGLQLALGAIFLWPILRPEYAGPALEACLLIHATLVVFRSVSFFLFAGIGPTTQALAVVEWILALGSAFVWWRS